MEKNKLKHLDFGAEVAKILPRILREVAGRQQVVFAKLPLTIPQIVLLEFLAEKGSCQMKELAKVLNVTMSAVTPIVDKMIGLKVVKRERSTEDRRVVNVTLLPKGAQMAEDVRESRRTCMNELFSALSEDEKNEYIRILKKVSGNLRRGK